ncbi:hypothetical protein [Virgisporangium aurantiacum]|uniref:Uncharacterized protein n=1 Tax=Virgisporangium aurantiacum TaxID=175570 RepID=A0A8J3Z652_9ACTN|nr:hypothetical protein [Virgisporangium aurantiacum]GIJ57112.1 hypothetical protein Vau01_046280 [Virgisporangium aurantiacum]
MDQYEDVLRTADRLFFSPFCDLWPRGDAHSGRHSGAPRWEPAFCVLPDGAAPDGAPDGAVPGRNGRHAEPVDGGLW